MKLSEHLFQISLRNDLQDPIQLRACARKAEKMEQELELLRQRPAPAKEQCWWHTCDRVVDVPGNYCSDHVPFAAQRFKP